MQRSQPNPPKARNRALGPWRLNWNGRRNGVGALGAAVAFVLSMPTGAAQCPELWGDVDNNGAVNVLDVECLLLASLETLNDPSAPAPACAVAPVEHSDVDCNGIWSLGDVQLTSERALGLALPAGADYNQDGCPDTCQAACGDFICASEFGEDCQNCQYDCGFCPDSCCQAHDQPGCNFPFVQACVCDISSFCCEFFWDNSCVGLAKEFCGAECFVPACSVLELVQCGDVVTGNTLGANSSTSSYSCPSSTNLTGPENFYAFQGVGSFKAKATLTGLGGQNLDVVVLGSDCESDNCLSKGDTAAEFAVSDGSTYYIGVDGVNGAAGDYTLTVTCSDSCNIAELCGSKVCGNVSCNGFSLSCGTCPANQVCNSAGACETPTVPGCPGEGDCFSSKSTIGCQDAACCALICGSDSFCCTNSWDSICASAANNNCSKTCGDGECKATDGEDCGTCPTDCGCGSGFGCFGGTCLACDGATLCSNLECGSVSCGGQTYACATCPTGESCSTNNKCFQCGDGVCESDALENCNSCPADCGCPTDAVCDSSGKCIGAVACGGNVTPIQCGAVIQDNNGNGVSAIDKYSCVTWNESGPEVIYSLVLDANAKVNYDLSSVSDLDVFVLSPNCVDGACVSYASVGGDFDAVAGTTYYIVVDGYNGNVSDFTLQVDCAICGDGVCASGVGENCNNCAQDCGCGDDVVCSSNGECLVATSCNLPAIVPELNCNQSVQSTTVGATNTINKYSCVSWNENGPEVVYQFTPKSSGQMKVDLTTPGPDLDVFVLSPDCNDQQCIGYGGTSATVDAVAGKPYYIVVDGYNGAASTFGLSMTCSSDCDQTAVCSGAQCGTKTCFGQSYNCGSCPGGQFCSNNQCTNQSPFPQCPGSGSCFSANGSPGCDNATCCIQICQADPFCCNNSWDSICASAASNNCQ